MNIKVHSSELNRMMKTISQCIDPKSQSLGNIEIIYDNNLLTIRGTNGSFAAVMSTPLLGGDGESFCVDGTMFARVAGMSNGEVNIITDEKTCTIKGTGRTRMQIVNAKIPAYERVCGEKAEIRVSEFIRCYNAVSYAISAEQTRPVLTGTLTISDNGRIEMVALDGFEMAVESIECGGENFRAVIPGAFLKMVSSGVTGSEKVSITVGKGRVQAETDGMIVSCSLLSGDYPDHNRILPQTFATECLVSADALKNALKCGSIVNTSGNLVKLNIAKDSITVMSNNEQECTDFDADIPCETQGDGLTIAFNQKYLMNTINSINADELVMKFNMPINPCIVQGHGQEGIHLVLPVRTKG